MLSVRCASQFVPIGHDMENTVHANDFSETL
ncbi:hypothetical protein C823_007961 [Eubacterium plexicaudatum ASF492]|uniref:Uncharacterized protein n=1 Tax=Eubacterium plexicaudatum ASF492 TaxID=1235802 RepID=N1ZW80_9FIRM|nr:hypothetical protein C823_007961 [Eubacterium plexicaudatum ASF492]